MSTAQPPPGQAADPTQQVPPPPGNDCCTGPAHTAAAARVPEPGALEQPAGTSIEKDHHWHAAATTARLLSWASLVWMTGEGVLGLIAGDTSGSISLIGWALGSVIEGLASIIVIWRFTGSRTLSETAETRATKAVAVSFFLLAPYLLVESLRHLLTGQETGTSALGIAVTAASVVGMPALGIAKQRLGARLASSATTGEGVQNLLCAAQAAAVLAGLALTATLGWWWIDPAVGLALTVIAVREGRRAWRGEDCC
jgi:divalent metal cation (Fe/Co/Zn/Cd) transporter